MIHIGICDDQDLDVALISNYVESYFSSLQYKHQISTFSNGNELLDAYKKEGKRFDLLFLDIIMDNLNGIQTAQSIREVDGDVEIIFCTATEDFALDSYDVFAFAYLVKPIDVNRMKMFCDRFVETKLDQKEDFVIVKSDYIDRIIYTKEIVYIESNDKALYIYMIDNSVVKTYGKLSDMQERINDNRFLRCHQSFIVNMDHITGVQEDDYLTIIEKSVPMRKRERKKFRSMYCEYLISKNT